MLETERERVEGGRQGERGGRDEEKIKGGIEEREESPRDKLVPSS